MSKDVIYQSKGALIQFVGDNATHISASGTITALKAVLGPGATAADGDTLLKFSTSRSWEFQAEGSPGSSQHLELKNVYGTSKNFRVVTDGYLTLKSQDGTIRASIHCSTGNAQFDGTLTVDTAGSTIAQEAWAAASFAANWENYDTSNYQPVEYFKDSVGVVHIRGLAKCTTGTTPGTTIFTLPSGYRPDETEIFAVRSNDGVGVLSCRVDVKNYGAVITSTDFTAASDAWVSLAGITFDTRS